MDKIKREHHHLDFSMQLEAMGLWHWAIFVILHLQDPLKRSKLAKEILGRNVVRKLVKSISHNFFLLIFVYFFVCLHFICLHFRYLRMTIVRNEKNFYKKD